MLTKRRIIFGTYDTAVDGLWTLTEWSLSEAEPKETLVDIPGRLDGPIDFTEALTGDVEYSTRDLKVRLESSEGTRLERRDRIEKMINLLHGRRVKIWLPDDADHYLSGRLKVKEEYNDPAHAAVIVTATCEPWRYENEETVITQYTDKGVPMWPLEVTNDGRRPVYPLLTLEGEVEALRVFTDYENKVYTQYAISSGTYILAGLKIPAGETRVLMLLNVQASGKFTVTYRKAVL